MYLTVYTWLFCLIQLLSSHSINAQCDGTALELLTEDWWQTQTTPGYNSNGLGSNVLCSWTIKRSATGTGVAFTVHDIDPILTSSVKITMYRGTIADDAQKIIITAATTIYDILSVDNNDAHITVETGTTANQKFQITFFTPTDQSVPCNSVLYAEVMPKIFSSPNFPGYYPSNNDCTWEFSSGSPFAVITFKFIWINIHNRSPCIDFVAIYYGKQSQGIEPTVKLCPSMNLNNTNYWYLSTGEYAYIKFHTDMFVSRSGFLLEYTSDNTGTVAESTFDTATVMTPGFETNFMTYLDYKLTIMDVTNVPGVKLLIQIHDVDVPCTTGARINVYDDSTDEDASKILLQDACDADFETIFKSTGPYLFIRFRTADSTAGKGFQLSYTSFKEPSGDNSGIQDIVATEIENYLSTQGFPSMYSSDSTIVYVISSGHATRSVSVGVVFTDFAPPCTADNLNIYNGNVIDDNSLPSVQTYCSSTSSWPDTTHVSTGQYLSFEFTSDSSVEMSGFLLKYWVESQCLNSDGLLAVTSRPQIVTSPGYNEGSYPTFLQCRWLLTKRGGTIEIEFIDFECGSEDWLKVFDGADNTATPLVENLCDVSSSTFGPVVSSSESLFVEFNTGNILHKGFAMKYVAPSDLTGSGRCYYNSDTQMLSMVFTATAVARDLYSLQAVKRIGPSNVQFEELPCTAGKVFVTETPRSLSLAVNVHFSSVDPLVLDENQDPDKYCEVSLEKKNEFSKTKAALRILVRHYELYHVHYDLIWVLRCDDTDMGLRVSTVPIPVKPRIKELFGTVPGYMKMSLIDANGEVAPSPLSMTTEMFLFFELIDTQWIYPVAARLHSCTVRPIYDLSVTQPILEFIDESGCPNSDLVSPDGGFYTYDMPPFSVETDPDVLGTYYFAKLGPFFLLLFPGYPPVVHLQCLVHYCDSYPSDDCPINHCLTQRKRSVGGKPEQGENNTHSVSTTIVIKPPPFFIDEKVKRQEPAGKPQELEDCFQSWIFVVVVVVLVILLVLAVLVSFFLLFQLNRNKQKSKQTC